MIDDQQTVELQQFVTAVLVQIVNGVKDAQEAIEGTGASINPIKNHRNRIDLTKVNMDVAIVATGSEGKKAGIGVAQILKAGMSHESQLETSTTSRVQFDVTVRLPVTDEPRSRKITTNQFE